MTTIIIYIYKETRERAPDVFLFIIINYYKIIIKKLK